MMILRGKGFKPSTSQVFQKLQKMIKAINEFLKLVREELVAIVIAAILFFLFRNEVVKLDPTAALYDLGRFEDLTYGIFKFWILAFTAWIAVRVILPGAFHYLQKEFYHNFKTLETCEKRRISLLAFLAFLFALVLLSM